MKNNFILNDDFNEIISLFENSNKNLFITGKAGTGKSSLINHIKKKYDAVASGIITKIIEWPLSMKRTQDLEGFFIDNGAVYVYKESLIKQKTLLSKNSGRLLVDKEEYVDIDNEFDFKVAEFILKDRIERGSQ